MTDTDALTERIAQALHGFEWDCAHDGSDGEWALSEAKSYYLSLAAAVLPIVAVEVRKAKAEAFDEGWKDRARRDVYRAYAFIDEKRNVPGPPASLNPYRETGDSDEH